MYLSQLTHAQCVSVGHAVSDFHLAIRALGAGLAGFGAETLLRKRSRTTDLAARVSVWTTLPSNTLTGCAFGARQTQGVPAQKEIAVVTFTLCVLRGRARGHRGNTAWALSTREARAETFG